MILMSFDPSVGTWNETNLQIDSIALREPLFELMDNNICVSIKEFIVAYAIAGKGGTGDGPMESGTCSLAIHTHHFWHHNILPHVT